MLLTSAVHHPPHPHPALVSPSSGQSLQGWGSLAVTVITNALLSSLLLLKLEHSLSFLPPLVIQPDCQPSFFGFRPVVLVKLSSQQIKACNSPNWLGRGNYSALLIPSSCFLCLQCSFTVTIPSLSPPLLRGPHHHSLQPANTWLPSHWQALLEKTEQDKLLLWASSFRCYFILHLFSNSLIYWFISWTIQRKL